MKDLFSYQASNLEAIDKKTLVAMILALATLHEVSSTSKEKLTNPPAAKIPKELCPKKLYAIGVLAVFCTTGTEAPPILTYCCYTSGEFCMAV